MRIVEHKGLKLSVYQWGARLGMKPSTISGRLERGWTVERALETKPDGLFVCRHKTPGKSASRNDAEMYLNDISTADYDKGEFIGWRHLPGRLFRLLPKGIAQDRPGSYLRNNHPAVFEDFYLKDFILRHHD